MGLPLLHQRARHRAAALEAEAQIGRQAEPRRHLAGLGDRVVVPVAVVGPHHRLLAVVQHRAAVEGHLHLAVDAAHLAQEDVLAVVVGGRPAVAVGPRVLVVPRADEQAVADDDPAGRRAPAGLEDHRAGQVATGRGHAGIGRSNRKPPASRSRIAPKTDGPSMRGRHIHSTLPLGATSAITSQSDRNAYSAISRVRGDGRPVGVLDVAVQGRRPSRRVCCSKCDGKAPVSYRGVVLNTTPRRVGGGFGVGSSSQRPSSRRSCSSS